MFFTVRCEPIYNLCRTVGKNYTIKSKVLRGFLLETGLCSAWFLPDDQLVFEHCSKNSVTRFAEISPQGRIFF
jgi:hypothetical protein